MATSPPADAALRAPSGEALLPQSKADDSAEIKFALSTAAVLWSYGAPTDALEWVRRAVRHAADAGDDDRAMELAKAASAIAGQAEKLSVPPPAMPEAPSNEPVERETSEALAVPPPPTMPTGLSERLDSETSAPPPVPLVTKPSVLPRPSGPVPSVRPPAPSAPLGTAARVPLPPRPASSSSNLAMPRGAVLPSKRPPAPTKSVSMPAVAAPASPKPAPASPEPDRTLPEPAPVSPERDRMPPEAAPASPNPAPASPKRAPASPEPAPVVSVPAPAALVAAPVASVAPPASPVLPSAPPRPSVAAPSLARPVTRPIVVSDAPAAGTPVVSQAVRAFVARDPSGAVTVRLAHDGEATPAGHVEVMLVALAAAADLASLFAPR